MKRLVVVALVSATVLFASSNPAGAVGAPFIANAYGSATQGNGAAWSYGDAATNGAASSYAHAESYSRSLSLAETVAYANHVVSFNKAMYLEAGKYRAVFIWSRVEARASAQKAGNAEVSYGTQIIDCFSCTVQGDALATNPAGVLASSSPLGLATPKFSNPLRQTMVFTVGEATHLQLGSYIQSSAHAGTAVREGLAIAKGSATATLEAWFSDLFVVPLG